MRQTRQWDRHSLSEELFGPRQVYVRSGAASHYVALSRPLQIGVAALLAVLVLWLGLASYAALAKHLETVEQARELARLEGITKALRTSLQEEQDAEQPAGGAVIGAGDLVTELAELKQSRERALMLADAAAAEADELRREVALAYERVRELELALVENRIDEAVPGDLIDSDAHGMRLASKLLEQVSCPVP